jgi:MFS family permease
MPAFRGRPLSRLRAKALAVASSSKIFGQVARSASLMRLVVAYAAYILTEYGVWIAMLVYAYGQGGATTAGVVALAQLIPAAIVGPVASAVADRRSPVLLMVVGYLLQALGYGAAAVAIWVSAPPILVYVALMVSSAAVCTTRPAQAALVPSLARDVGELTAANVLIGWVESVGIMTAGAVTGVILAWWGVEYVFGVSAVLVGGAALLVWPLRAQSPSRDDTVATARMRIASGFGEVGRSGTARLLVGLLAAEYVVIGALDILFVVLAINVLHLGQAWVGYLNMAYGAGGVILGGFAILLVGRRLGPVIVLTAVLLGLALGVTAVASRPVAVVVLLSVVGGTRALFDVSTRSLLQRAVPADMVARLFGIAEGLSMVGLAAGSLLAPALIALGNAPLALATVAAILPILAITCIKPLVRIDRRAQVPIVEISLLRSLPIFHGLPAPAVEGIAHALERVEYDPGTVIMREGDPSDRFYAIAHGSVEILQGGHAIAMLGRGAGLGEIALLREGMRTATAVASTSVSAVALDRASFLTAVNGHAPTRQTAEAIVRELRARDQRRRLAPDEGDSP